MRDKFWWFYGFRNLNSDNWTPGYYNTQTGQPEPVFTTLRNHATKLNYRLNSNHTPQLLRAVQQQVAAELRRIGVPGLRLDLAHRLPVLDSGRDAARRCSRTDRRST